MNIAEPTTTITNFILGLLAVGFAVHLYVVGGRRKQLSIIVWATGFVGLAVAALAGGISHGFVAYLGDPQQVAVWKLTVYAIALAAFFMVYGATLTSVPPRVQGWILAFAFINLLWFSVWMINHDEFLYVIINYAPSMLAVLILQAYARYRYQADSAWWVIAAVVVTFIGSGIQQSGFALHPNFNHNDLYHVVQMVALFLFYRAGLRFEDRKAAATSATVA